MTEQHPITPSPELIEEWIKLSRSTPVHHPNLNVLATYAARWGANRELQFCLDWFQEFYKGETWMHKDLEIFAAARRPKPPSLKEQALAIVENLGICDRISPKDEEILRRALESLTD